MVLVSERRRLTRVLGAAYRWILAAALGAVLWGALGGRAARAIEFEFVYTDPGGIGFTDPVLGAERRGALEYAGSIWGALIRPAYPGETVTVHARFDADPDTFGAANSDLFYGNFGSSHPSYQANTHYAKALASHLNGGDVEPGRHDIDAKFGLTTDFYYGTAGSPAPGQSDFISLALHELAHGLGFADSFRGNGAYGLFGDGTYDEDDEVSGFATRYDRYLTVGPGGAPLLNLNQSQRAAAIISNNIFWNGPAGIAGNGGAAPRIFAPTTYDAGSSIAHIDQATFNGAVMTPNQPPNVVWRTPFGVERGMLRDLGWDIAITTATLSWTGAGPDNQWSTGANWSGGQTPRGGDSVSFGPSPQTDVALQFVGGGVDGQNFMFLNTVTFAADAPAYTLHLKPQSAAEFTGQGIVTLGAAAPTITLESSFRDDVSSDHTAADLTFSGNARAGKVNYILRSGGTLIAGIAPPHGTHYFDRHAGASITFADNSEAGSGTFLVEGGSGDGGPNASITFRQDASAGSAEFRTKGGALGPSLPLGLVTSGFGGRITFKDDSKAGTAILHNDGQTTYFNGSGGFTIFEDKSTGDASEIHNHGATQTNGFGGATYFTGQSTAGAAEITNHADGSNFGALAGARTIFEDYSNAGTAKIENEGSPSQAARHGRTEFHDFSSAEDATINNRGYRNVGDAAGRTLFFDDATAHNAFLYTYNGYSDHGRIEFHDRSTASQSRIFLDSDPLVTASRGGYLFFYGNSTAAQSRITLRTGNPSLGGLQFYDHAALADARVFAEDNGGGIVFWGNSTAGDPPTADTPERAFFELGRGNIVSFYDFSTADDARFTLEDRSQILFQMNSSAGESQIELRGGSAYTATGGATVTFNSNSTAHLATITAHGATAPLASPAAIWFINGSRAGHSTLTANGGSGGGNGAVVTFTSNAKGDTARLIANAGGLFDFNQVSYGGTTTVGSIEGAGTFYLRGTELVVGTRNINTEVTGRIIDTLVSPIYSGGRLTKVGTGVLTLAGANTYTGVTTVSAGTLRINGSVAGDVVVQAGARLGGTGTIGGTLTNNGGKVGPGLSPGTLTLGGLTMSPSSILEFELGATQRDHIVLTGGNVVMDGTLNVTFVDGYTPLLGQSFSLFEGSIGSVTGAFDSIIAPIVGGLSLNLVQIGSNVALQVGDAAYLPADFDRNGVVNSADLTTWRGGFGTAGTAVHTQGDADGDADVDGHDFLRWQRQLGMSPLEPAAGAVPEPATASLATLGLVLGARGRWLQNRRLARRG